MKKLIFIIGFFLIATNANAMFNTQDEHLHYLDITTAAGTSSADILNGHLTPDGVSVSSLSWNTTGGNVGLVCKPTATSTQADSWYNYGNRTGFIEMRFFCPYHIYLNCDNKCWVGLTTVARNYATTQGTSTIRQELIASTTINNYYGLATSTASSTVNFMSTSSIENISYSAIETDLGNGRKQIEGQYNIPMALYIFIVSILLFLMVIIYLFNRKKWS